MNRYKSSTLGTNHGQWPQMPTPPDDTRALVVIVVIASCSRGGSGDCGGGRVTLCHGGCMVRQSRLHGLTVVVAVVSCHGPGMKTLSVKITEALAQWLAGDRGQVICVA